MGSSLDEGVFQQEASQRRYESIERWFRRGVESDDNEETTYNEY